MSMLRLRASAPRRITMPSSASCIREIGGKALRKEWSGACSRRGLCPLPYRGELKIVDIGRNLFLL